MQLKFSVQGGSATLNVNLSPGNYVKQPQVHCNYGEWKVEIPCTKTCGSGFRKLTRKIIYKDAGMSCPKHEYIKSEQCNVQPCLQHPSLGNHLKQPQVHCIYDEWKVIIPCTKTCGGGVKNSTRKILYKDVGMSCPKHEYIKSEQCNTQPCPIDCQWSSWSKLEECSKTCGGGFQIFHRSRQVKSENGGKDCLGNDIKVEECKKHQCPGKFFHTLNLSNEFRIISTYKHFW